MENPYTPSGLPADAGTHSGRTNSSSAFWCVVAAIVILGISSIVGRQWGVENSYGHFGGYGHFPLVWLGGFAIYPGYILALLSFQGGDWILCFPTAIFMLVYYLTTITWAINRRNKNAMGILVVSYLISLGINLLNFIFVGLLHL